MNANLERVELLFRRQLALEGNAPPRSMIRRIDPVPGLCRPAGSSPAAPATGARRGGPATPAQALLASPGHFNASRIGPDAAAWAFLTGTRSSETMERILLMLCNVQSAKQNFRPVFLVEIVDHVELMRRYGFTFEVLADPGVFGLGRAAQVELFMRKWNCRDCVDLSGDTPLAGISGVAAGNLEQVSLPGRLSTGAGGRRQGASP